MSMNMLNCKCAHSLYCNHQCKGILVDFEILPGIVLAVCEGCREHIVNFDSMLVKSNLPGFNH